MKKYKIVVKHPVLAVPLGFAEKYDRTQFTLLWIANSYTRYSCSTEILHDVLHYYPNSIDRGGMCVIQNQRQFQKLFVTRKHD